MITHLSKKATNNFTMVPNELFNSSMSIDADGLYVFMLSYSDTFKFNHSFLKNKLKLSSGKLSSLLAELKKANLLTITQNGFKDFTWILTRPAADAKFVMINNMVIRSGMKLSVIALYCYIASLRSKAVISIPSLMKVFNTGRKLMAKIHSELLASGYVFDGGSLRDDKGHYLSHRYFISDTPISNEDIKALTAVKSKKKNTNISVHKTVTKNAGNISKTTDGSTSDGITFSQDTDNLNHSKTEAYYIPLGIDINLHTSTIGKTNIGNTSSCKDLYTDIHFYSTLSKPELDRIESIKVLLKKSDKESAKQLCRTLHTLLNSQDRTYNVKRKHFSGYEVLVKLLAMPDDNIIALVNDHEAKSSFISYWVNIITFPSFFSINKAVMGCTMAVTNAISTTNPKNRFCNFTQREYNFEALEKKLVAKKTLAEGESIYAAGSNYGFA